MAKKINPKDQTEELSRADWELLRRNPGALEAKRNELISFFPVGLGPEDCDDIFKTSTHRPAARAFDSHGKTSGKTNEQAMEDALYNARFTIHCLTQGEPLKTLLVGIDLSRSKETIMTEFEALIESYQKRYRGKEPAERLKWLSILDELLEVWDSWVEGGEPARQAFPAIAKRLDIPESTVKARWYRAYELIYGAPYENDPAKRREQRTDKALALCLKCTNPICRNKHGGEEIGCPAYEKLAGKNISRERSHENLDKMTDGQSYEAYEHEKYDETKDD